MQKSELQTVKRQKDTLPDWAQKKGASLYAQIQEQLHSFGQTSLEDLINQIEKGTISPEEVITVEHKLAALHKLLILKNESHMKMEYAQDLFGKDFFGPEQIEKSLGIEIPWEIVPELSCNETELQRAKELGQTLELYVDRTVDGNPITAQELNTALQIRLTAKEKGKVLCNFPPIPPNWFANEDFFAKDTPRLGWRFTSKQIIPGSEEQDYLEQTFLLIDYIRNVFEGMEMPPKYTDAIIEFEQQKQTLMQEMTDLKDKKNDGKVLDRKLAELAINQLCRQKPVEAMYHSLAYLEMNNERLLERYFTWTTGLTSEGKLVIFGRFFHWGALFDSRTALHESNHLAPIGVCISRAL